MTQDELHDHCIQMLEEIEMGDVTAHDCYVDQIHDAPSVLSVLEGTRVNIDELDFLARRLDGLDETELAEFQAMAYLKEYRDVQDLINLSFNVGTHTVITGFSDLEAVGKHHYLIEHGGAVPAEEMDMVNGIGVALNLIASGEGRVTPYGVLYGSDWPMDYVYSGYAFPPYRDQEYLMEFTLDSPQHGDVSILLPTPESRLERLLFRSGVSMPNNRRIKDWDSSLSDAILEHMNVTLEPLEELNRLCAAIADMDEHDLKTLEARSNSLIPGTPVKSEGLRKTWTSLNSSETSVRRRTMAAIFPVTQKAPSLTRCTVRLVSTRTTRSIPMQ